MADRQRQEEIYHHHVKVEAQRQGQAQVQGQAQIQGQVQVQGEVQVQGGPEVQVQAQQTDKSLHTAPPPRLPPEDGGGGTTSCKVNETKQRPFQTQVDDDSYVVEVAQIGDTKSFVGSVLQQFNATFH